MLRSGYSKFSFGVLIALSAMIIWVAAGYGFPGGSVFRRIVGQEGPTGGLTTAMREVLRGRFSAGFARQRAAPWVSACLIGQIGWRVVVVCKWSPNWPKRIWIVDLVVSLLSFAAAIWLPWWSR